MMWAALNCPSVWTKISAFNILVRSSSLTRLKFGIVEYLSENSPKRKTWLEYNIGKNKNQFTNETEEVNTKIISKGYC